MDWGSTNWDAVGAIAEALGAGGVIVTLVYLTVQLRQNTRAMKSSTFQQLSVALSESAQMLAENPHLIHALLKAERDPESLNDEERASFQFLAIMSLRRHETAFVQRSLGAVDANLLKGFERSTLALFASRAWRLWWSENKQLFSDNYRDWVDDQIQSGSTESIHFFTEAAK